LSEHKNYLQNKFENERELKDQSNKIDYAEGIRTKRLLDGAFRDIFELESDSEDE
jgi:hypothetical protein